MSHSKKVTISAFIKFGQKEHILDLYENGIVYCNTLQFFRDHENPAVGDKYEGTSKITNTTRIKSFEIIIPGLAAKKNQRIKLNPLSFHLREFYTDPIANLFCLYTIERDDVLDVGAYKIDPAMTQFNSSHLIIFHTPGILIERMVEAIKTDRRNAQYGFVDYYDMKTFSGELSMFSKPMEFAYQKEFRFLIGNDEHNPFILKLGSLKDISIVLETTLLDKLEFKKVDSNENLEI